MKEINLNHICKIEGHAHLTLKIEGNKVVKCELKASEGARFFEALVINKELKDIQEIVTRICGICSCAHSVAAVQALEEALGVKPSEMQKTIRELLMIGERIRSHVTHLYFLSLPDYYNASSALSLGKEHKEKINDALSLISLGNKIVEVFGGRDMHPFLAIKEKVPEFDFSILMKNLEESEDKILRTVEIFSNLDYPKIEREVDYLSIKEEKDYAVISGNVVSNSGVFIDDDYKKHLSENIKEYATSKFVLKDGKPYMLGAIARINNNHDNLDKETKELLFDILNKMNLNLPLKNPHHNNLAQAIELLYMRNRAIELINKIPMLKKESSEIKIKAGVGVSCVEAPRGSLFHEYKIDKNGKITYCNIITPTAQNLNMMELDITRLVNILLEKRVSQEEIIRQIEKLIRCYDPCFSCSTHFLQVKW
ncbi:MAG: Ni/Fe hydrogenase subunit alpha [Nanoarchaeota archaeon]|nr:Ni/Fe hydrogenase subunit alpha [Nanoarchaeota archaeon]